MVAISAPTIEKMTTTMPEKIAADAVGEEPAMRGTGCEKSMPLPGQRPSTYSVPSTRNTMIAATLMLANQYSNSP